MHTSYVTLCSSNPMGILIVENLESEPSAWGVARPLTGEYESFDLSLSFSHLIA